MAENTVKTKTKLMAVTGLMTAMTVIFTAYIFHIPVGVNGGYVHFGDSVIYLAAALLPTPYAFVVGAWMLPTIIIKMLIVLPFSSKGRSLLSKRNMAAPIIHFSFLRRATTLRR